jgi:hypothetical protein
MLLAGFTSGLLDEAGKFTRFNLPENMDQAIKIATTLNQAKIQERRNETFYVDEARSSRESEQRSRGQRCSSNLRNTFQQAGVSRTQGHNQAGPSRNLSNSNDLKCFECGGVGHFARVCLTRNSRLNPSKSTSAGSRNKSQGYTGNSSQEAAKPPPGRRNDRNTGNRESKGSGDSSFHISVPENVAGYFTVRVQSIAGAPTIQVEVSGIQRVFVLDTGSGISLIQPGVYPSEIKPTNLSPFGVTSKELEIQGIQEVTFRLNGREFSHQFCVCSLPTDVDGIIGIDYLTAKKADLNLEKSQLRLLADTKFIHGFESQRTWQVGRKASHGALTVFVRRNGDYNHEKPIVKARKVKETREQECKQRTLQFELREGESWIVKTTETIKLAPRVKHSRREAGDAETSGKPRVSMRQASPVTSRRNFSGTQTLSYIHEGPMVYQRAGSSELSNVM